MKKTVLNVLCILVSILLTGCDSGGDSGPKNPIRVLVMGDSQSSGGNYSGVPPWVSILAVERPEWRVVNQATPGETSAGGRSRIAGALQRHSPDVVVIMYGANDAIQSNSPGAYEQNISSMVAACKAAEARVVLVNTMPMFGVRSIYNGNVTLLNDRLRSVASRERVTLADVNREFRGADAASLFPDGLHPNLDATRILFVSILGRINSAASGL